MGIYDSVCDVNDRRIPIHIEPSRRCDGRQVLAYRVWFDQRRGWRYTNPNLEQLELVTVEYLGLDELAADDALFSAAPDV